MIYAPPISEYGADAQLFQLQRLENRVLRAIDNFNRRIPVSEITHGSQIPYGYSFITELRRKHEEVIQNHLNPNVRSNWPRRSHA
jgi:hypothetical protein